MCQIWLVYVSLRKRYASTLSYFWLTLVDGILDQTVDIWPRWIPKNEYIQMTIYNCYMAGENPVSWLAQFVLLIANSTFYSNFRNFKFSNISVYHFQSKILGESFTSPWKVFEF